MHHIVQVSSVFLMNRVQKYSAGLSNQAMLGLPQFCTEEHMERSNRINHLFSRAWNILVVRPILAWQYWRCTRAHAYLLAHDRSYRMQYASIELVRRRNKLYESGISPADPRIPDLWDVEETLPAMAWPQKGIFSG